MTDSDDLARVRRLIAEALPTLLIQTQGGVYPYELRDRHPLSANLSMSTNSMVAHALASAAGYLSSSVLAVCRSQAGVGFRPEYRDCLKRATQRIVDRIFSPEGPDDDPYGSPTFGKADPMTLAWLTELLGAAPEFVPDAARAEKARAHLVAVARQRAEATLRDPDAPVFDFSKADHYARAVVHPLPLLRMVHIAQILECETESQKADVFDWFRQQLHLQLSRQGIEYSEFDIAELVLCLEGMLTTDASKVTKPIIDRVSAAIDEVRRLNPTLRPITPFKTSVQGGVHLFSSVEVFGSLLRSATILERLGESGFFAGIKPALHDYLSWLQGTKLTGRAALPDKTTADPFPAEPMDFAGWQSEYAHTEDRTVHVWVTSQVLVFLYGYETLLAQEVARHALTAAGLVTERREPSPGATRPTASELDPLQAADPNSPYRVVSRLDDDFVQPRLADNLGAPSYSCLLYGPPGTGKTTLARWVAEQLGWPLLTVTTSDFIIDGEARVEARAKDLFDALDKQSELVVFFDEIDRLILDRDASAYADQGDMLQFMTPSMLTKINNLRSAQQVVFVIGTNYADRIDAAIKRAGRIDHRHLVLPPDLARREQVLRAALDDLTPRRVLDDHNIVRAAQAGVWRTIAELKAAARRYGEVGGDLALHVEAFSPQLSLPAYKKRINGFLGPDGDIFACPGELLEEAFLLAFLLTEGQDATSGGRGALDDYPWLRSYWTARGQAVVRDPAIRQRLGDAFAGAA